MDLVNEASEHEDQPPPSNEEVGEGEGTITSPNDPPHEGEATDLVAEASEDKEVDSQIDPPELQKVPADENEAGSSDPVAEDEEDKKTEKKKRYGKSLLKKVRSLSFKRQKREAVKTDTADPPPEPKERANETLSEHETSVATADDSKHDETPAEKKTSGSLVKKMKSFRITKKSKSEKPGPADNDTINRAEDSEATKAEEEPNEELPQTEEKGDHDMSVASEPPAADQVSSSDLTADEVPKE